MRLDDAVLIEVSAECRSPVKLGCLRHSRDKDKPRTQDPAQTHACDPMERVHRHVGTSSTASQCPHVLGTSRDHGGVFTTLGSRAFAVGAGNTIADVVVLAWRNGKAPFARRTARTAPVTLEAVRTLPFAEQVPQRWPSRGAADCAQPVWSNSLAPAARSRPLRHVPDRAGLRRCQPIAAPTARKPAIAAPFFPQRVFSLTGYVAIECAWNHNPRTSRPLVCYRSSSASPHVSKRGRSTCRE